MLFIICTTCNSKAKKNKVPFHTVADRLLPVEWSASELWQLETKNLGNSWQLLLQEKFGSRMLPYVCQSREQILYFQKS